MDTSIVRTITETTELLREANRIARDGGTEQERAAFSERKALLLELVPAVDLYEAGRAAGRRERPVAFTIETASILTGASECDIRSAINAGDLPASQVGTRLLIPRLDLEQWIADRSIARTVEQTKAALLAAGEPVEEPAPAYERRPDCPPWCTDHTWDSVPGEPVEFTGHSATLRACGLFEVSIDRDHATGMDSLDPHFATGALLTADQARTCAAVLVKAADMLDESASIARTVEQTKAALRARGAL